MNNTAYKALKAASDSLQELLKSPFFTTSSGAIETDRLVTVFGELLGTFPYVVAAYEVPEESVIAVAEAMFYRLQAETPVDMEDIG